MACSVLLSTSERAVDLPRRAPATACSTICMPAWQDEIVIAWMLSVNGCELSGYWRGTQDAGGRSACCGAMRA